MVIHCPQCQSQVEPIADGDRLICPSCRSPIPPWLDSTSPVDWKPEPETSGAAVGPSPEAAPRKLGDFEVLREIGRGGMGIVYEARQVSLNRKVALKVLGPGLGLTPKAVLRFRREAEAAARLHHTNIVPIYTTGEDGGAHYYAMELVEGPSLDRVIGGIRAARKKAECPEMVSSASSSDSNPPWVAQMIACDPGTGHGSPAGGSSTPAPAGGYFDTVARLMAEVADALEYAHGQGVIHRDIKPSNLLLSPAGRLSLNDFGLARILEQPGMTLSGEFVGSPMYMSPEQIAAGRVPLDHRTDIYSLGATLYEFLALEPPFSGESRDQVLGQILHKEPRPPRRVNRKIPLDLETICLKAMEKDPDRRYPTAGKMAEDLRRFTNRFAIGARRIGPIGRARKWVRRHRALAAMMGCAVLLAVLVGFFAVQARMAGDRLRAERRQNALDRAMLTAMSGDAEGTEKAIGEAEALDASTGRVLMVRGLLALYGGDPEKAIEILERAAKMLPDSVAALSLLADAYSYESRWSDYERIFVEELQDRQPVTAEDYLFKGHAESFLDPRRGLESLDEAIRRRNSPGAHILRAHIRANLAMDTGDVEMIGSAIGDAYVAKEMMHGNPISLPISLAVHLAAAKLYRAAGKKDEADECSLRAGDDARALERFPRHPMGIRMLWTYLMNTGKQEAAYELIRKASDQMKSGPIVQLYVFELYMRDEFEKARDALERARGAGELSGRDPGPSSILDQVRPYILAELPDGPSLALQACRENERRKPVGSSILYDQTALLLLGKRSEVMAACRELRKHEERFPRLGREHSMRIIDYLGGILSEEDLLNAEKGSRLMLGETHFFVALDRLAQGDRAGAREHFQRAAGYRVSYWNHAFLRRMDRDPKWPPWIPVK